MFPLKVFVPAEEILLLDPNVHVLVPLSVTLWPTDVAPAAKVSCRLQHDVDGIVLLHSTPVPAASTVNHWPAVPVLPVLSLIWPVVLKLNCVELIFTWPVKVLVPVLSNVAGVIICNWPPASFISNVFPLTTTFWLAVFPTVKEASQLLTEVEGLGIHAKPVPVELNIWPDVPVLPPAVIVVGSTVPKTIMLPVRVIFCVATLPVSKTDCKSWATPPAPTISLTKNVTVSLLLSTSSKSLSDSLIFARLLMEVP